MTRALAALALVASLTACQTRRQSLTVMYVGLGVGIVGGLATATTAGDDEGPPVIFPLAVLVGGGVALLSALHALTADE